MKGGAYMTAKIVSLSESLVRGCRTGEPYYPDDHCRTWEEAAIANLEKRVRANHRCEHALNTMARGLSLTTAVKGAPGGGWDAGNDWVAHCLERDGLVEKIRGRFQLTKLARSWLADPSHNVTRIGQAERRSEAA